MKGKINVQTPEEYLNAVDEDRRAEVRRIFDFVRKVVPKLEPFMLNGFLGFGPMHYKYASGREGDWFKIGLASNKQNLALYICAADDEGYLAERYAKKLGKCSCGKSCIRFKKFDDLDQKVLKEVLKKAEKMKLGM
jgi:Domain of unknown function (DU1801)